MLIGLCGNQSTTPVSIHDVHHEVWHFFFLKSGLKQLAGIVREQLAARAALKQHQTKAREVLA
eukprot:4179477-Amphidinium_carterae.1